MMREYFVLVPRVIPSGPGKGAVALANELANSRPITLVSLKPGNESGFVIDPRVRRVGLSGEKSFMRKCAAYKSLLRQAGGRDKVVSISSCFSGDGVNMFCRGEAVTCSSVRGNLFSNYSMDFGWPGHAMAFAHLISLRRFDHVLAMTGAMARQLGRFCGRRPEIVGNFVDEEPLEAYRLRTVKTGPLKFVFLASLSKRKRPLSLIRAIAALRDQGHDTRLDMIGEGPLIPDCRAEIGRLDLADRVTLHGQLSDPYPLVAKADAMVLPSLSEGVSRAALEALYLGVPCVLRDVDGNDELIQGGANGRLFMDENNLPQAMLLAAQDARVRKDPGVCLLPDAFRQETATRRIMELMERA